MHTTQCTPFAASTLPSALRLQHAHYLVHSIQLEYTCEYIPDCIVQQKQSEGFDITSFILISRVRYQPSH